MIRPSRRIFTVATAAALLGLGCLPAVRAAEPIKIGLVAALSGQSALSGEAITRGLQTAIDDESSLMGKAFLASRFSKMRAIHIFHHQIVTRRDFD